MKRKFDKESISIKPPAMHAWMQKHFCPNMVEILESPVLEECLKKYNAEKSNHYSWAHLHDHYTIHIRMCVCETGKDRTAFRLAYNAEADAVDEGLLLGIFFSDDDYRWEYYMRWPLGGLYLLPYMFRAEDGAIHYVEEHWKKLRQLGLIDDDLWENLVATRWENL